MAEQQALMSLQVDESAQLRSVEEALLHKFGHRVTKDQICAEVQRTVGAFDDARVRTFVPVLVQHNVTDAIRHLG